MKPLPRPFPAVIYACCESVHVYFDEWLEITGANRSFLATPMWGQGSLGYTLKHKIGVRTRSSRGVLI